MKLLNHLIRLYVMPSGYLQFVKEGDYPWQVFNQIISSTFTRFFSGQLEIDW